MVTNVSPFLWGMKAEVVSAEEAVALIGKGVWWDGKKYEAELWKNARLRALGGSQRSGRGSPPSGPGGNRGEGGGYEGLVSETPGQSMDCRTYVVTIAGGVDIMQEPALYVAGTQVDTFEREAINDRGDLKELLGMHQRDQGRDTHQTAIRRRGTMGG